MVDGARRFGVFVAMAMLVAFGAAACTGTAPAVLSVAIDGGDLVTDEGGTRALSATVTVQGGAAATVAWTTDDATVATIDADGVLTGQNAGTTTVSATSTVDPTRTASVQVRVQASGMGTPVWTSQIGGPADETARAIAIGADGRIAVAGSSSFTLSGNPSDLRDGVVFRWAEAGTPMLESTLSTFEVDDAYGIAITAGGGDVVVGNTGAGLEAPGAHLGATDAFVRAYQASFMVAWTRQFGTVNGDTAYGVAVGPDDRIAIVGASTGTFDGTPSLGGNDVFVRLYEPNGDLVWSTKFGSDPGTTGNGSDTGFAVAVDADGRVVVAGRVSGTLARPHAGNFDAFVRAYTPDGEPLWTEQFGTATDDVVESVAVGSDGRIAVTGSTRNALDGGHAGAADAFVRVYEPDGTLVWARQFGTTGEDEARAVGVDAAGNVLVAGRTEGALIGSSAGDVDGFVRKYDPNGTVRWTQQIGTSSFDSIEGLAVDPPTGEVLVVGTTAGVVGLASGGGADVFVRRTSP
jgi:hypothetical protein